MTSPARVIHSGSAGRGGFVVLSHLDGHLRVDLDGAAGETPADLRARADRQLDEQRLIAETVAETWPRCGGETPDQAHAWQAAGITMLTRPEHHHAAFMARRKLA